MGPAFPLDVPFGEQLLCLVLAWAWDRFAGEPPPSFHPVVWMGRLIKRLAQGQQDQQAGADRPLQTPRRQLLWGAFVAFFVPALCWTASTATLLGLADSPLLRVGVSVWLLKSSFALAGLGKAAMVVRRALDAEDLPAARVGLGSLCSRDASALNETEVAAAAVESVAENASDSVVAPLFYYFLFGVPGALVYRAVNTADAMIGYHGRYEYLGKVAARLDDVLNFVPARLTALLLLAAGALHSLPAGRGLSMWWRDGGRTESPNAGRPMATMAGLLGVRLAKAGCYELGDATQPLDGATIARATRVLYTVGWIALALVAQGMVWFVD